MPETDLDAFELAATYVFVKDNEATPVDVTPTFWKELMTGEAESDETRLVMQGGGWLVTAMRIDADTPTWEMHPAGDELLILRSGALDIVFQDGEAEHVVSLVPGAACRVPRGTWHRVVVNQPGDVVGMTYGEGTKVKPVE